MNLIALLVKLIRIWLSERRSVCTVTSSSGTVISSSIPFSSASGRRAGHDLLQDLAAVHGLELELDVAGLDLGQIEQVVDDRQQVLAVRLHGLELLPLLGGQRTAEPHQDRPGEPEHGVERRAQLVAHAGEEPVLRLARRLQLEVRLLQLQLEALALGDVPDGGDRELRLSSGLRLISTWNSVPSLRSPHSSSSGAHRAHPRLAEEASPVLGMARAVTLGDQHVDVLADELFACVAEELLRLAVRKQDLAAVVEQHHRVGGGLHQSAELAVYLGVGRVARNGAARAAVI